MRNKDEIINVTRSDMPPMEEFIREISSIWDSRWLTNMGEKHIRLESEIKDYLKVENVTLFSHGHAALELLLQAMDLKGEVITTPFSFASTTHAIVRNGLKPVFCDIKEDDYTIDETKIEALITPHTSAILPVHVYGQICNVEAIEEIAKKHNLKVIYDAAHTFGEEKDGVGVGNFGDASMFSFHATKVFHTIEGGAVTSKDRELKDKLYYLKNFGIQDMDSVPDVGANAKMNEFQAAMGLCNLRYLDEKISHRKQIYDKYVSSLESIDGIKLLKYRSGIKPNYAYFPIVVDPEVFGRTRDDIFDRLKKENIICRKYFYPLISDYECYRDRFPHGDTPVADRVSSRVLTLPIFAELSLDVVDEICELIIGLKH